MCADWLCLLVDFLSQITLGIVVFLLIRKAGFPKEVAKWAFLIPAVWIIDVITGMMELDKVIGWFGGPASLNLPFDIFGFIAPFTAALVLLTFLKSNWPSAD